ncbi:hypothetical protein DFH06DRAFT_1191043 [Mycena polygramma]|nr:hypothetical protein DFH06DRAFT_1191043 [Mycena polygramma]
MLSALAADRARIASLNAQISDLERALAALRSEKALVEKRLVLYKYPVLTLPNEIVSDIFIHFLPAYPSCPPLAGKLSPTSLTHVCRQWREIALTTPVLWRAIELSAADHPLQQLSTVFDLWLDRSRSCPLSVCIRESEDHPNNSVPPKIFAALIQHRARWEYLDLALFKSSLPNLEGPTPLLRHLKLMVDDGNLTSHFHDAPLLRSADLTEFTAGNVTLPWGRLTSLTLQLLYPADAVAVLQQTSRLVHCELRLWCDGTVDAQPDVTLPCLESLVFHPTGDPMAGYLGLLIAPALRTLQVDEDFLGWTPVETIASFISKSGCKLQELCINGRFVDETPYRTAFPSIPRLSFPRNEVIALEDEDIYSDLLYSDPVSGDDEEEDDEDDGDDEDEDAWEDV